MSYLGDFIVLPQVEIIEVACGILLEEDKVYLTRRKENVHLANKWEFPGGKKEQNESITETLIRELKEEINITVTNFELFEQIDFIYAECRVKLFFYLIKNYQDELKPKESQIAKWVLVDDLSKLDFPKANEKIIQKLITLSKSASSF